MAEADNNTKDQKLKISKWATASMYSAFTGLALMLLSYIFYMLLFNINTNAPVRLLGVGFILIIFGFAAGIIALICIKVSKEKLKGKGLAISGIIISLIPIVLFGCLAYGFYMAVIYEKLYDDSNPEAIIAKVEKVCDFDFPEKIESLKAAEKLVAGIDPGYAFIARFTTDQNSFAELRNSLSKAKYEGYYSEEINDELPIEDGKSYTYGSRKSYFECWWQKNAPEWFDTGISKGKVYELYPSYKMMHLYFICVELPDSNDVVVNVEGLCINRALIPKLINAKDVNDLKWKDEQKQ